MFLKTSKCSVYLLFVCIMSCQFVKSVTRFLLSLAVKLILYFEMSTAMSIDLLIST